MQRLEVSVAVRLIYKSLGVKGSLFVYAFVPILFPSLNSVTIGPIFYEIFIFFPQLSAVMSHLNVLQSASA